MENMIVILLLLISEGQTGVTINMAQGRHARHSSWGGGSATLAVDGDNNGFFADQACSRTQPEELAWWTVDLGFVQYVSSVIIYNRADCCGEFIE